MHATRTVSFSSLYHTDRTGRFLIGLRCWHDGRRLAFLRIGTRLEVRELAEYATGWAGEAVATVLGVEHDAASMRKAALAFLASRDARPAAELAESMRERADDRARKNRRVAARVRSWRKKTYGIG